MIEIAAAFFIVDLSSHRLIHAEWPEGHCRGLMNHRRRKGRRFTFSERTYVGDVVVLELFMET